VVLGASHQAFPDGGAHVGGRPIMELWHTIFLLLSLFFLLALGVSTLTRIKCVKKT